MLNVEIFNRQRKVKITGKLKSILVKAVQIVFNQLKIDKGTIYLHLLSDKGIQKYNKEYLFRNSPTDVIAFSLLEGEFCEYSGGLLGDIMISVEQALAYSETLSHSFEYELAFLAVHGALHIIGYDDSTTPGRSRMIEIAKEILTLLRD